MTAVRFGDLVANVADGETALDALIRSGASVRHACRAGSCGSCMLKVVEGLPSAASQAGLKDAWKARGYFLPCVCRPDGDLTVAELDDDARVPGRIVALDPLGGDVLRVRLAAEGPFTYRPGQFLTIVRSDGLARSYSIASLPEEPWLELHVRLLAHGRMSGWLREDARVGDQVALVGPSGDCFYVAGRPEQPLLLAGTGTGLSPLYGILRDALRHGHAGPMHLVHGALSSNGLYLQNTLRDLARAHHQVEYVPTVYEEDGPLDQVILSRFAAKGSRAFLCGDPTLVLGLRKKLFLSGLALSDIHADAFLPAAG